MWELVNRTRFAAERTFARDRDGAEVLLVVVKATFTVAEDGGLRVADEQVPIERTPRHSGDPLRSSLLYDSDFALVKHSTDVLLVGQAQAPGGKASIAVEVSVRVGAWQKRLLAIGNRRWERGVSGWWLTDPEPFVSMPIVYERAFGGVDDAGEEITSCEANPVGTGFSKQARSLVGRAAPNLEDPTDLLTSSLTSPLTSSEQNPRPMSFGPIAREWPSRCRLAGTFDDRWRSERRPLVPEDFDDAFWQSAPPDQRAMLQGGEEVELIGASPRGVVRFELPRLSFSFYTRLGGKTVEHPSSLHTVLFEPDHDRVVLVVQSALPCHHAIHTLERTTVAVTNGDLGQS